MLLVSGLTWLWWHCAASEKTAFASSLCDKFLCVLCWECSCTEKEEGPGLLWLLRTFQRPPYCVNLYIAMWSRLRQLRDSPLEAQLVVRWLRSCYLKQWGPWDLGDWAESFPHISRRYFLLFSLPISLFFLSFPSISFLTPSRLFLSFFLRGLCLRTFFLTFQILLI